MAFSLGRRPGLNASTARNGSAGSASKLLASPYVGLVLATMIWGGLHPAGKFVMREATPIQLVLARCVFACVTLSLILASQGRLGEVAKELRHRTGLMALLGAVSFFGSSGFSMIALSMLPASISSLLSNSTPLFVAVGAIAVYRTRTSPGTIIGIVVGFLGLGVVVFGEDPAGFGNMTLDPRGVLLSLAGALTWAIYIGAGRKAMATSDPLAVVVAAGLFGSIPWVLVSIANGDLIRLTQLDPIYLLVLALIGVVATGLTYALWTASLVKLSAATVAVFQYAIPFWAVVLSVSLLGEHLTIPLVVGGMGIIAGIVITQRSTATSPR